VIVVEWAGERTDESTARWRFERLDPNAEPSWLRAMRDGGHSGVLAALALSLATRAQLNPQVIRTAPPG
jgi:hypothetical protein